MDTGTRRTLHRNRQSHSELHPPQWSSFSLELIFRGVSCPPKIGAFLLLCWLQPHQASSPSCLVCAASTKSLCPMCLLVPTATGISQRDDGEPPWRSPTTDPPSSSRFIFKSCSSSIREHDSVISQHRPPVNP
ncbi:hypothetical protein F2Q69_00055332 [Brassica cretica]|uniref:Uncharacterized protein n=1 Tax=Brassica cretica TaxID=69181 RepID=A0A8S9MWY9_BRACR|nr:hypothetical protein F2Q69_00055332 [Brassica cretica]